MTDETEVETVIRIHAVDIRDLYPNRAPEDASSRVCLLCSAKLKDKTHNLTRHLERHHAGALLQLLEQRNLESPRVLTSKSKRVQQEKSTVVRQPIKQEEGTPLNVRDAQLALARWLAREQLPVDLIEKAGFQQFIGALNEKFSPPTKDELLQLLGTLMGGTDTTKQVDKRDTILNDGAVFPIVEMLALKATCRCNDDVPLISCSRIACDIVTGGKARVKVLRAAASLLDAQTCRGKVLGKNGVLGRTFVGIVSEMPPSESNQVDLRIDSDRIRIFDKVVSSLLDESVKQEQHEQSHEKSQLDRNLLQCHGRDRSCNFGSAFNGALAQYMVLPVSNLWVVPAAVPDDLALLSDDMSVVLSIACELQRREVVTIAILSDGPSTIVSNLLTRYLHQAIQFAPQNLHVFSASTSVWSQHASIIPLDIYQPKAVADVMARQTKVAVDAIVDLVGSEASTVFATQLVQPMGLIVLVGRAGLELNPPSTIAMDMNSVVVRELEVVGVFGCRKFKNDALQYLATQATNEQSVTELRECLINCVQLSQALNELQTISERTFEAQYLQVALA